MVVIPAFVSRKLPRLKHVRKGEGLTKDFSQLAEYKAEKLQTSTKPSSVTL